MKLSCVCSFSTTCADSDRLFLSFCETFTFVGLSVQDSHNTVSKVSERWSGCVLPYFPTACVSLSWTPTLLTLNRFICRWMNIYRHALWLRYKVSGQQSRTMRVGRSVQFVLPWTCEISDYVFLKPSVTLRQLLWSNSFYEWWHFYLWFNNKLQY